MKKICLRWVTIFLFVLKTKTFCKSFQNVNLLMFVLILVNTVIASGAYAILVSLDPFLLIFEIIIAMDIAMEIFSFCSTVAYVTVFND